MYVCPNEKVDVIHCCVGLRGGITTLGYAGDLNNSKTLADCTWLSYNGPRKLYLQNLLSEVLSCLVLQGCLMLFVDELVD